MEGQDQSGIPSPAPATRLTCTSPQPCLILQPLTMTCSHNETPIPTEACYRQHAHFRSNSGPELTTSSQTFGLGQQARLGRETDPDGMGPQDKGKPLPVLWENRA